MFCMDDMVPQDHLLRIMDKAINWNFIYDLVDDRYSSDTGRPGMDSVMLIKLPVIQYLYSIRSMRQTVKEIIVFVNVTHVKARANNKKMQKCIAHEEALFFKNY